MRVRVLVQCPLARRSSKRLRLSRIREQVAIRVDGLLRSRDDEQLPPRLEPLLHPFDRVGHDRGAGCCEFERPAGRRRVNGRVRAARDVEVDPRRGDRTREDIERNVADRPRSADVAAKVAAAEREVGVRQKSRRLADECRHPFAPELVAVAVEEDVVLLVDVVRVEQLGVGRPENRLRAPRSERAQPFQPALGVGEHEVVLLGIGAVVVSLPDRAGESSEGDRY